MRRLTGILLIVGLIVAPLFSTAADLTLITEELPPFNFTEKGELTGATTQVVREIARRLNTEIRINVLPWSRGYKQLLNEPNVVLFTTAKSVEREALFHWVGPLYISQLGFFARREDARIIDSIAAAKQVGAVAAYQDDYGEHTLTALGFSNLDVSNSPVNDLRKLLAGRVDLWFFHSIGAHQLAQQAGIDPKAFKLVLPYQKSYSYIAFSKQTAPAIVQQWQAALDDMKADGTFWWLARKWLPADSIAATQERAPGQTPLALQIYTEDYPPSAYVHQGELKGLSVEIVQEILRRVGQPDTISVVPWARGYKLASTEANIALFSTTRLPQREELFSWVGPLYRQRWGFYRWKGANVYIPDMQAARKVARIGTYHQDAKMQYLEALGFDNLVPTNRNITNITHLRRGNIDLWVSSDFNLAHLAWQAGVNPNQLELAYAFHTVHNYIAFSKATSPHVVRLWQMVLDEIKSDGSYEGICRQYNYLPFD